MEELRAAGFNAWGQLQFDNSASGDADDSTDFRSFTLVLRDEAIHAVRPLLSYTIVNTSFGPRSAGLIPRDHRKLCSSGFTTSYAQLAEAGNSLVAGSV